MDANQRLEQVVRTLTAHMTPIHRWLKRWLVNRVTAVGPADYCLIALFAVIALTLEGGITGIRLWLLGVVVWTLIPEPDPGGPGDVHE